MHPIYKKVKFKMPRSKNKNIKRNITPERAIGYRLRFFMEKYLKTPTVAAGADKLGVPRSTLDRWIKGDWISKDGLTSLSLNGCNIHWLLTGYGDAIAPTTNPIPDLTFIRDHQDLTLEKAKELLHEQGVFLREAEKAGAFNSADVFMFRDKRKFPPGWLPPAAENKTAHEPVPFVLETKNIAVVGKAAADETQGARAGFFPPDPEAQFDEIFIPEFTSAVEIIGDSMSPVLLNGQYALLGPEYVGTYDQPKDYEIVVADVEIKDDSQEAIDKRWEGVYCKRIVDAGDTWLFLSINHTGTPFTIAKANCRIWPVVGVWFAGKGVPPEE